MKKNKIILMVLAIIAIAVIVFNQQSSVKTAAASIGSATITRSFSAATVKAGGAFTVSHTAAGFGSGSWGVLISDKVSGGCSPNSIDTGWLSPQVTESPAPTFVAPSTAGSCVFNGNYTYAGGTEKSIAGPTTVTICADQCISGTSGCTSSTQRWTCTSGVCNTKTTTSCASGQTCSFVTGTCSVDCVSLKSNALTAISAWQSSQTSALKSDALTKISSWAVSC